MERNPSYQAQLSISRATGGRRAFYGSKVLHDSFIVLELRESKVSRDLGQEHFSPGKIIAKVEMSSIQFADLITNMNTTGVPVTINQLGDVRYELPKLESVNPIKQIREDQKEVDDRVKMRIDEVKNSMKQYTDKGKPVPIKVAKELQNLLESVNYNYDEDRKFYADQAQRNVDTMLNEAKAAVESHITHRALELGFKPENFFLTDETNANS
jgi:hypothetical protein